MRFKEHINGPTTPLQQNVFVASTLPPPQAAAVAEVLCELIQEHNLSDDGAGWGTCYTGLSEVVTEDFAPEAPSCGKACRRIIEVTATDAYAAECYVSVACPSPNGNGPGEEILTCTERHKVIFAAFGNWAIRQTTASNDNEFTA